MEDTNEEKSSIDANSEPADKQLLQKTTENSENNTETEGKPTENKTDSTNLPILDDKNKDGIETQTEPPKNEDDGEQESSTEYDPKNVTYEGDVAIYTDPKTNYKFKWDTEKNEWVAHTETTYGFEDDTHTYTDVDGLKYFWDVKKSAWFPKINDDFLAQYQMNYGFGEPVPETAPKKEEKPAPAPEPPKPKPIEEIDPTTGKRKAPEPTWFEMDDKQNTKVYISNLPTDISEDEFVELMSKYGIIMRDVNSNKLKIKLYMDPVSKELKGDALCTYIRKESVDLALKLLDGMEYKGKTLHVELAKFQMKGQYDPKLKPKIKKRKDKDKLKKMQEKLFDWRPEKKRGERAKHERVVILKNVFDPKMFDEDVGLILELQEDIRQECTKCGDVRKVNVYDRHPEGVVQINMQDPDAADACVLLLNNRWFSKRQITAEIYDGKTKFKIAETDSEINQRLEKWDKFLESEDKNKDKE